MEISLPVFLLVLVLGVVQLAVGMFFGRLLFRGKSRPGARGARDAGHLSYLAGRVCDLTTSVADDVGRHQNDIRQVNQELAAVHPPENDESTKSVLKSVAQIMQVNERLQNRLREAEERLQQQSRQIEAQVNEARTDPLTGLPNRRAFNDELTRRLAEWQRKGNSFCLIMIDIDHFKRLNDQYGHPAGDSVLHEVADVLTSTLREMDMTARLGGEEFAVILPSTEVHEGHRATERARLAIASHRFHVEESKLSATVSLGLALVEGHDDAVSLMKRADDALYAAKHGGRNCGYFHDGCRCTRIEQGDEPTAQTAATAQGDPPHDPPHDLSDDSSDDPPGDIEMAAVCGDLRDRLAEVADTANEVVMDSDGRR